MCGEKEAQINVSNGCSWEPCGCFHPELSFRRAERLQHFPLMGAKLIFMSYQTQLHERNGKATGSPSGMEEGEQGTEG